MDISTFMPLLYIIGASIVFLIGGFIGIRIIRKRNDNRRNYSLPVSGNDSSEFAEMLAEKFRNERLNEKD